MKKYLEMRNISYFLMSFLLFAVGFVAEAAEQKVIKLGTVHDDDISCSLEILKEAYDHLGYSIELSKLPAERSLQNSNSGILDGEVNRKEGIQEIYPNLIQVGPAIRSVKFVAVSKQLVSNFDFSTHKDSCIVYQLGIKKLEEYFSTWPKTRTRPTVEECLDQLNKNSCQIYVGDSFTIQHIQKTSPEKFYELKISDPIFEIPLHHYLNAKHKDLAEKLSAELSKMQKNGRIKKLRAKCD